MLVRVDPKDGAQAVRSDATLVLEFNNPMDVDSVEAAYGSPDLPKATTTWSWNASHTTLSIKPKLPLAYSEVPSAARVYNFVLTDRAADVFGQKLPSTRWSFATLRTQYQGLSSTLGYTIWWRCSSASACTMDYGFSFDDTSGSKVGDFHHNPAGALPFRSQMFVTFDLSSLPTTTRDIEQASLSATLSEVVGDLSKLKPLSLDAVTYTEPPNTGPSGLKAAGFDSAVTSHVADLDWADGSLGVTSANISDAVRTAFENRQRLFNRVQLRLGFANTLAVSSGAPDAYFYIMGAPRLGVTALVP